MSIFYTPNEIIKIRWMKLNLQLCKIIQDFDINIHFNIYFLQMLMYQCHPTLLVWSGAKVVLSIKTAG